MLVKTRKKQGNSSSNSYTAGLQNRCSECRFFGGEKLKHLLTLKRKNIKLRLSISIPMKSIAKKKCSPCLKVFLLPKDVIFHLFWETWYLFTFTPISNSFTFLGYFSQVPPGVIPICMARSNSRGLLEVDQKPK